MKVLLLNGSPHPNGCTFRALSEVEKTLQQEGIETEIFHIGTEAIRGCMGCGMCRKNKLGRCIFGEDAVNVVIKKMEESLLLRRLPYQTLFVIIWIKSNALGDKNDKGSSVGY